MAQKRGRKSNNSKNKKVSKLDLTFMFMLIITVLLFIMVYGFKGPLHQNLDPILSGIFGPIKYLLPFGSLVLSIIILRENKNERITKMLEFFLIFSLLSSLFSIYYISTGEIQRNGEFDKMLQQGYDLGVVGKGGGYIGTLIALMFVSWLGELGATLIIICLTLILTIITMGVSPATYMINTIDEFEAQREMKKALKDEKKLKEPPKYVQNTPKDKKKVSVFSALFNKKEIATPRDNIMDFSGDNNMQSSGEVLDVQKVINRKDEKDLEPQRFVYDEMENNKVEKIGEAIFTEKQKQAPSKTEEVMHLDTDDIKYEDYDYQYPPLDLLTVGKKLNVRASKSMIENTANLLQKTLYSFGVSAKVTDVSVGPTITRYELKPAQGVKVSRISNLADDIALNLAAETIRIEAPIPGKQAVGIEVPNEKRESVTLRDVLDTEEFREHKSKISFALGKGVGGNNVIADVYKMPHLLVAGSTGSGKSVCINSIVTSILYKSDPNEVKFLMVDPKVVELSIYNQIPHLLIPVITEPLKASAALKWAVQEMMKRYNKFAEIRVKDIDGYNKKKEKPERMPKIIILIDELADLMMVAAKEVEDSICRLAQMGRAAGMHLVIATQRPSVDVITGLIKANVPSRIAFAVSSIVDSRTILDSAGAEKLLGKGDMLYAPAGSSKFTRVQGAFVSEEEITEIVEYIKRKDVSETSNKIEQEIEKGMSPKKDNIAESDNTDDKDELLTEAIERCVIDQKASISYLRRKFKIGDSRAGRLIDEMEQMGIVSQASGNKGREVLITQYQWEEVKERFKKSGDSDIIFEEKEQQPIESIEVGDVYQEPIPSYDKNEEMLHTDGTKNSSVLNRVQELKQKETENELKRVEARNSFKINNNTLKIDKEFVSKIMDITINEPYFMDVIEDMVLDDEISTSYIKRKYKLNEQRANMIMDLLSENKLISMEDYFSAVVTISKKEWNNFKQIYEQM